MAMVFWKEDQWSSFLLVPLQTRWPLTHVFTVISFFADPLNVDAPEFDLWLSLPPVPYSLRGNLTHLVCWEARLQDPGEEHKDSSHPGVICKHTLPLSFCLLVCGKSRNSSTINLRRILGVPALPQVELEPISSRKGTVIWIWPVIPLNGPRYFQNPADVPVAPTPMSLEALWESFGDVLALPSPGLETISSESEGTDKISWMSDWLRACCNYWKNKSKKIMPGRKPHTEGS